VKLKEQFTNASAHYSWWQGSRINTAQIAIELLPWALLKFYQLKHEGLNTVKSLILLPSTAL